MSGLFSALSTSAGTLDAIERSLDVTQNNVSNASTPGYASQTAALTALPFDTIGGLAGGVQFTGSRTSRDESAEQFVQQQNTELGTAQAITGFLSTLQTGFDVTGSAGVDGALTQLYGSFSALSQDPNSASARQQVLVGAQSVALAIRGLASATSQASASAGQQIASTVEQINQLASTIQQLNQQIQSSSQPDPNVDANLHQSLETLSGLANITTSFAADGTVNVLVNGQIPIVLGTSSYSLGSGRAPASSTALYPAGNPSQIITDSSGRDITSQITGGQLGGLLQVRNVVLPSIQGDTEQVGSLNQLAQGLADRVNALLTSGESSAGPPPVSGVPLFQYSAGNPTTVAATLQVTSITGSQIATIDPGPPYSANGVAQKLGDLPTSSNSADQINGLTFDGFYAQISASFGQTLSSAQSQQDQQTAALAQAQSLRSQVSGVSLDEQAVDLVNFQKSYEATSKLVSVLNSLTETTINLIQ